MTSTAVNSLPSDECDADAHIDKVRSLPHRCRRGGARHARQAEAERDKRAKIINAEGEIRVAEQLANAANIINAVPIALQQRYVQTLADISSDQSRTIIFPFQWPDQRLHRRRWGCAYGAPGDPGCR